ncbi:MAG: calcium-binding protein, partial [Pseudomonadota bacterium]
IGIAQIDGLFTQNGTDFNASMLTLNFARSGTDHFLTGVSFADLDEDDFYGVGEGVGDIVVSAAGTATATANSGGYAIATAATDSLEVSVSQTGTELAKLLVDLSDGNAKLDVIFENDGSQTLALSATTTLQSGIANAVLLGVADLDLTGSDVDNILTGNSGRNALDGAGGNDTLLGGGGGDALSGGAGDDILRGGEGRDMQWDSLAGASVAATHNADILNGDAGNDRLHGQSGRDVLDGGAGDDRLTGGGGRDTFVFKEGNDRILDFDDNVDLIAIDPAMLGLAGDITITEVLSGGEIVDGDAVFDFGGGNSLRINDVSDLSVLLNDMILV